MLISGSVFNDANGDKLRNSGEAGLSGWRVFVDKDKDGVLDAGENSVLSDSAGNWKFRTLAAGSYALRIVQQTGWTRTTPAGGAFAVTLGSGATTSGKLFGEKRVA